MAQTGQATGRKRSDRDEDVGSGVGSEKRVQFSRDELVKEAPLPVPVDSDEEEQDEDRLRSRAARIRSERQHVREKVAGEVDDEDMSFATTKGQKRMDISRIRGQEEAASEYTDSGVRIEPFNLKREMEEGYFDGDGNYVLYRKGEREEEEEEDANEADAWLADYKERFETGEFKPHTRSERARKADADMDARAEEEDEEGRGTAAADLSRLQRELVSMLRPGETVGAAVRRLRPATHAPAARAGTRHKLTHVRLTEEEEAEREKRAASGTAPVAAAGAHAKQPVSEEQRRFDRLIELADALVSSGMTGIVYCYL